MHFEVVFPLWLSIDYISIRMSILDCQGVVCVVCVKRQEMLMQLRKGASYYHELYRCSIYLISFSAQIEQKSLYLTVKS